MSMLLLPRLRDRLGSCAFMRYRQSLWMSFRRPTLSSLAGDLGRSVTTGPLKDRSYVRELRRNATM